MPLPINVRPAPGASRIAVITAACGSVHLKDCVASVNAQSFKDYHHYVIPDGNPRIQTVRSILRNESERVSIIEIPECTGLDEFNGHRIYGSLPFLLNAEFVCFLDEDNRMHKHHLRRLIETVDTHKLDWAYSLRNIVSNEGNFLCRDDCDSLGIWGSWYSFQHHIDTNCYLLKRELAVNTSALWNRPGYSAEIVDPDKAICRWLLANNIKGFTSGAYTIDYRLGSSEHSVTLEYFLEGNEASRRLYQYFPWNCSLLEAINPQNEYRRIVGKYEKYRKRVAKDNKELLLASKNSL